MYVCIRSVSFGITSSIETKTHTACVCSVLTSWLACVCITSIFSLCKRTSIERERANGEENNEHSIPSKKFANEYFANVDYAPWQYFNLVSVMIVRMSGNVDFCFGSVWFLFCYCNYYLLTWHPIHTFPTRCKELLVYTRANIITWPFEQQNNVCMPFVAIQFCTKLYSNLYHAHREIHRSDR